LRVFAVFRFTSIPNYTISIELSSYALVRFAFFLELHG
jgi:hypothetical protein